MLAQLVDRLGLLCSVVQDSARDLETPVIQISCPSPETCSEMISGPATGPFYPQNHQRNG